MVQKVGLESAYSPSSLMTSFGVLAVVVMMSSANFVYQHQHDYSDLYLSLWYLFGDSYYHLIDGPLGCLVFDCWYESLSNL